EQLAVAQQEPRDDRVVRTPPRLDRAVDEEARAAVVERDPGPRSDEAGAEAFVVALDEGDRRPLGVDRAKVDRAAGRLPRGPARGGVGARALVEGALATFRDRAQWRCELRQANDLADLRRRQVLRRDALAALPRLGRAGRHRVAALGRVDRVRETRVQAEPP